MNLFGEPVEKLIRKRRATMTNSEFSPETPKAKRTPNVKSEAPKAKTTSKKKAFGPKRLFPKLSLEDSLKVSQVLKINGGKPFATKEVAKACDIGQKTPSFFYLVSSSKAYGLTEGSTTSQDLSLTAIGRGVVLPESPESKQKFLLDAFFSVPVFKDAYEHYHTSGGVLPEMSYLESKLLSLNIPTKEHDSFAEIYKKNYEFLKLSKGIETLQKERLPSGGTLSVVGQSPGTYQHHAFIIMPFSEKGTAPRPKGYFSEMLLSLLTPACNSLNFRVSTANVSGSDLIHHTIIKNLIEADLVIADLTDHNPNVAFELGVRIALDKPVCIIRAKGMGPFFDVDNLMRVYEYDPCLWTSTLKTDIPELTTHIRASWENKSLPSYMKILTNPQLSVDASMPV